MGAETAKMHMTTTTKEGRYMTVFHLGVGGKDIGLKPISESRPEEGENMLSY